MLGGGGGGSGDRLRVGDGQQLSSQGDKWLEAGQEPWGWQSPHFFHILPSKAAMFSPGLPHTFPTPCFVRLPPPARHLPHTFPTPCLSRPPSSAQAFPSPSHVLSSETAAPSPTTSPHLAHTLPKPCPCLVFHDRRLQPRPSPSPAISFETADPFPTPCPHLVFRDRRHQPSLGECTGGQHCHQLCCCSLHIQRTPRGCKLIHARPCGSTCRGLRSRCCSCAVIVLALLALIPVVCWYGWRLLLGWTLLAVAHTPCWVHSIHGCRH